MIFPYFCVSSQKSSNSQLVLLSRVNLKLNFLPIGNSPTPTIVLNKNPSSFLAQFQSRRFSVDSRFNHACVASIRLMRAPPKHLLGGFWLLALLGLTFYCPTNVTDRQSTGKGTLHLRTVCIQRFEIELLWTQNPT